MPLSWDKLTREQRDRLWAAIPEHDEEPLPATTIYHRQDTPRLAAWKVTWILRELWHDEKIIDVPRKRNTILYFRKRKPKPPDPLSLAVLDVLSYNGGRGKSFPVSTEFDAFLGTLYPLRYGQSVRLWWLRPQRDGKVRGKPKRLVILSPWHQTGLPARSILVSIVGSGSSIIRLDEPKVADLVLAGMSARLANELVHKMAQVFEGA